MIFVADIVNNDVILADYLHYLISFPFIYLVGWSNYHLVILFDQLPNQLIFIKGLSELHHYVFCYILFYIVGYCLPGCNLFVR